MREQFTYFGTSNGGASLERCSNRQSEPQLST
jgi:hypothetical protein